jgi:hypothetical protein
MIPHLFTLLLTLSLGSYAHLQQRAPPSSVPPAQPTPPGQAKTTIPPPRSTSHPPNEACNTNGIGNQKKCTSTTSPPFPLATPLTWNFTIPANETSTSTNYSSGMLLYSAFSSISLAKLTSVSTCDSFGLQQVLLRTHFGANRE